MQERIRQYVLRVIEESDGIYLVDFRLKGSRSRMKVEIILDTDSGIRIEQCARFSRRLRELLENDSELLDETGDDYELTVSSPGLGEPLKLERQYLRHAGKPLRIVYKDETGAEKEVYGRLTGVMLHDEGEPRITILPAKSGKAARKSATQSITIILDQIVRAVPEADV
jgi:ribosome maturation factor RimP